MQNKPNFICVGAQKAGTTTLYDILHQHPDVFLPETKELHFFDWDKNFTQGEEYYFSNFENASNQKAIGEITPNYMYIDYVPERIAKLLGNDLKLIFLLRNPVNRSFSHYLMNLRNGRTDLSFKNEAKLNKINSDDFLVDNQVIGKSLYDIQINNYLKYFDIKNMFFIVFETEFLKNQQETLNKLCDFLEVGKFEFNLDIQSNKASYIKSKKINKVIHNQNIIKKILNPILSNNTKSNIKNKLKHFNKKDTIDYNERETYRDLLNNNIFSQSIKNLEKIINKDLSFWLEKKQ